jgi:hypothetical protein
MKKSFTKEEEEFLLLEGRVSSSMHGKVSAYTVLWRPRGNFRFSSDTNAYPLNANAKVATALGLTPAFFDTGDLRGGRLSSVEQNTTSEKSFYEEEFLHV